jgi:hypothetical protein
MIAATSGESSPVQPTNTRFATRLNSFASKPDAFWPAGHGKPSPLDMARRAATAQGLTDVDLNYPDHLGTDARATGQARRGEAPHQLECRASIHAVVLPLAAARAARSEAVRR